jgi:hypothetical protein
MAKPAKPGLDQALTSFMASMGLDDAEIETELSKPVIAKPPVKHTKRGRPRRDEYLGPPPGPPRRRTGRARAQP